MKNKFLLFFILIIVKTSAQNYDYKSVWDSVEYHQKRKDYENANRFLAQIKINATQSNNPHQRLKVILNEMDNLCFTNTKRVDLIPKISNYLESEISKVSITEQAILNQIYANYLIDNLFQIKIEEPNAQSQNFIEWPVNKQFDFIDKLLNESMKNKNVLKAEYTRNWENNLFKSLLINLHKSDKELFSQLKAYDIYEITPTLFHLLAHDYNRGKSLVFETTKNEKTKKQIEEINHELEKFNLQNNYKEAFQYYSNLLLANTPLEFDQLYQKLNPLQSNFDPYIYYKSINLNQLRWKFDEIPTTIQNLEKIIATYPQSIWTKNLIEIVKSFKKPELSIDSSVDFPSEEYHPISITHKNVDHVYIRVYPINFHPTNDEEFVRFDSINRTYKLNQQLIYEEKLALKKFDDYKSHTTLYKINPLPTGKYIVLMSNNPAGL